MEVCVLTPADLDKFAHLYPPELPGELPGDELLLGCAEAQPPRAAGILMAHVEDGEVLVDWLYVDEDCRRKGGGKGMLDLLIREAEASGMVDGVSILFSERDEDMEKLLEACGFLVFSNGVDCGYETVLRAFPKLPAPGEKEGELVPLGEVPGAEHARFASVLDKGVIPGAAVPTPFDPAAYLPESSACLADGKLQGLCLLEGDREALSIAWIYSGASTPATLPALVNDAISRAKAQYAPETPLRFASVNGSVREIIERYIPVKQRVEVYLATVRFDL